MNIIECIKTRRSVRNYLNQPIEPQLIEDLIEAAIWAPSGKNSQPWKFCIVNDNDKISAISNASIYGKWMRTAPCFIVVFLDKTKAYDYVKDVQSCGAAIQNILLSAHSSGLGACWVGEILKNSEKVKEILNLANAQLELMAVITIGYPQRQTVNAGRNNILTFII